MTEKNTPKTDQTDIADLNLFYILLASLAQDGLQNIDEQTSEQDQNAFFEAFTNLAKTTTTPSTNTAPKPNLSKQFNNQVINISANTPAREAFRDALSASIASTSQSLHGTKYEMGGKIINGKMTKTGIDCSGFVAKAVSDAVRMAANLKIQQNGQTVEASFNGNLGEKMLNHSEGQLAAMIKEGVPIIRENQLANNLKGGMIIAMDTGKHKHDQGRDIGIDHIVMTYEKDGQIYIAQSSSGKGVNDDKLASEWLKDWKDKKLYAVDLVDLAHITTEPAEPAPNIAQNSEKRTEIKNNFDTTKTTETIANTPTSDITIDHNA